MTRPLDYKRSQPDGLYVRCICGEPWSAHLAGYCANGTTRYYPDLGADDVYDWRPATTEEEEQYKAEHTLTVTKAVMDNMEHCGAMDFPRETCGFVFGDHDVCRIRNIEKGGWGSYTMDPMQMLRAMDAAERNGTAPLRIIFHSHPNMSAFFSSIDRREAMQGGEPTYPETKYIVMSIRTGTKHKHVKLEPFCADARAYQWNPAIKDFSEITLKVEG